MNVTRLNFEMRLIFMFVVIILFKCNQCTSTLQKSIVFILDKKGTTTENDIHWLSENAKNIANKLRSKNWMSFSIKLSYYNPFEPRQSSLELLLQGLRESPSYSVIYVMTNVTKPSNETPIDDILEEIQIKRTQVNFLIGTEISFKEHSLPEYELIASVSNGFIKGPEIFQSNKFTEEIYLRLNYKCQVARMISFQQINNDAVFCAPSDSFYTTALKDFIVGNCTLKQCTSSPEKPQRSTITITNMIETHYETSIKSIETISEMCDLKKLAYPLQINDENIRGFSGADYDFDYGFTGFTIEDNDVCSLEDTYRRPMNGRINYIYVSLTDKNFEHGIDHFKIRFLNDTQFGENIAVKRIENTDLFVGLFNPPQEEYFYIEVITYVNQQTTVSRISSTAMNAAYGFGDDHRNPMYERRPIFKTQPVINDHIVYFFIGALFILIVVLNNFALKHFTPYLSKFKEFLQRKFRTCSDEHGTKKPQQQSGVGKNRNREVPNFEISMMYI